MSALRRAANPARTLSRGIFAAQQKLDTRRVAEVNDLSKCFSDGPMTPRWSLRFSSQAGAKSSDGENDLAEGFSNLEIVPEASEAKEAVEDDEVVSAGEVSEDDVEGVSANSLRLADGELDDEKAKGKRSCGSQLFKILIETPWQSVNRVLDKWVEEGNPVRRCEVSVAMFYLRKHKLYGKALQFVEWLEARKHLDVVEHDYASHLDLVAKVHGLQKAEKYIEKIPESFRSEVIYRTLLANCVGATNVKKAEAVFNKMRDLGFPVTTYACNQLLLLYKRVDRKIVDVLIMMEKENVKPSIFTYRLLIESKGRANDIQGMEQIVKTMKDEGFELDLQIQAMIAKHYIFGGHRDKAKAALKEIEGDNIKENRIACRELLLLYADLGQAVDVRRVWKVCEANPRLVECLAAIKAFGKLGDIEGAEQVFENMMKKWTKLSTKYYNSLLKVYANHKLLTKGKELAKRMSNDGCKIGPLTWDTLVKLYVEAGEVEKADSILQKVVQQNMGKPLYNSYMAVMSKYVNRGDIHNAEKIFHRLKQNGHVGRMGQYQSLLQAYINAKVPAHGFRERMEADNMFPNKAVAAQLAVVDAFRKI